MNRTISKKFEKYITETKIANGGGQSLYKFDNGRGASVICGGTFARGLELAVLDSGGRLDYSTHVTDDVIGHQTESELDGNLKAISELEAE